ncbi:N-acetylglucosamine-6-phosphate deacetylase [Acidipropionibacterium virtanenii]|uniref:N-acetylglucosamine-6-phosphate deacetylase n=1 Tax=Acidipropionibacterium virtanenii TaxID=2057246 RepID=A0A344UW93_9ACTN|nr:amidohydrolase family protein [Acidipropionibacterium virtanenii]AXE39541.1 N-acetylglucosamine-6-phosphate deacetylase [Acidipropionibacterium virtanenii]
MIISSRHVLNPDGSVEPATITVDGERISEVARGVADPEHLVDEWVLPGYVDTHCHGAAGVSFVDTDHDAVVRAIEYHRSQGSTTLFASTVAEEMDDLVDQIGRLRGLVDEGELDGIHLEGPFLAASRKGAHDLNLLREPAPARVSRLIDAGGPALRMITLAPELRYGIEATGTVAAAGVHAAFGHSDADAATARDAVDAGVDIVTHLFNAMAPIHHRKPGPVPWMLTDPRVMCELICDGVHVAPDVIRMVVQAAGTDRVGLVTDAMSATGQPDGDYMLGSLRVRVINGGARLLNDDGSLGAIAGSTLTLGRAVEFLVTRVGIPLAEAATMASATPASWHGLDAGRIEPGARADLCLTTGSGHLERVLRAGREVPR